MSNVPDILYSLPLLKDLQTQPVDLVIRFGSTIAAGWDSFTTPELYTVPKDRVGIIQAWGARCFPDPVGGTCTDVSLLVRPFTGGTLVFDADHSGFAWPVGKTAGTFGGSVNIWIPPGSVLLIGAEWNVAANHRLDGFVSLITIPRGSVSVG